MSKTYFDSVNKIWSGTKMPSIYNSNVSVGYLILNTLQNTPDAITQVSADNGSEFTCKQMYQKSVNIASYLQKSGYKPGDIAGIVASNSDNLAPIAFACLTLGLPICSLAPTTCESEIIFFYSKTKPKLIFCDADIVEIIQRVVKVLPNVCTIFAVDKKVEGVQFISDITDCDDDTQTFQIPHLDPNSFAFIMATSGTSDNPKQACKSHKEMIEAVSPQWKSKPTLQEIWLNFSGLYWKTGIYTLLEGTLYGGKRIITARPFEPNLMLEIISKYNVSTTIIVPRLLVTLFNCKFKQVLNSMKIVIITGLAASKDMCEKAKLLFPNSKICHSYGCTESCFLSTNMSSIKYESVGQLFRNVEMKILNDEGIKLGICQPGEIVYKASTTFPGYFNDPVKTAETIKNGWIVSGDIGYFDEDGFLFIIDRKKDFFKCYGAKGSAAELEKIIADIDGVILACVVSVYQDETGNDLIFAFVVKKPDSDLNEENIENYVSERVVDAKRIRGGVHFVDTLPLTHSGKVRKGEVKKLAVEKCRNMNF